MVSVPDAAEDRWPAERFATAMAPFYEEHPQVRLDPSSRSPANTRVTRMGPAPSSGGGRGWLEVAQVVCDSEDDNDWLLSCWIDLEASAREGAPVVAMRSISR
jgi:hypothetical protein